MKKAGQDLINGRGDWRTNVSKLTYYGFVQNLIFNVMQQALFALLPEFDPDDDEEKYQKAYDSKLEKIINGMMDTILRGIGIPGAIAATIKNIYLRYAKEEKKGYMADHAYTLIEAANISPPIGSKLRKFYMSTEIKKFERDPIAEQGWGVVLDGRLNISPRYEVIGNLSSALFNLPLDRALMETEAISEMLDARNTAYQRLALALGWRTWDVNAKNEEHELMKIEGKARRKKEGIEKGKKTREENKRKELERVANMSLNERIEYERQKLIEKKRKSNKARKTREKNQRTKDSLLLVQARNILNKG
jgi:hypothetical protein